VQFDGVLADLEDLLGCEHLDHVAQAGCVGVVLVNRESCVPQECANRLKFGCHRSDAHGDGLVFDEDPPALDPLLDKRGRVIEGGDADAEVLRGLDDLAGPEVDAGLPLAEHKPRGCEMEPANREMELSSTASIEWMMTRSRVPSRRVQLQEPCQLVHRAHQAAVGGAIDQGGPQRNPPPGRFADGPAWQHQPDRAQPRVVADRGVWPCLRCEGECGGGDPERVEDLLADQLGERSARRGGQRGRQHQRPKVGIT
jgi:hypothetical protein